MDYLDYKELRKRMIEEQISSRGITNGRLLQAFKKVERHKFVPQKVAEQAYSDFPLPIGEGQTISQPYMVVLMTDQLNLAGEEKVLEIGTGSGYQAAILSLMAKEVYTIERTESLGITAEKRLKELGYNNVSVRIGDGTLGWEEKGLFDRIVVTAASPRVPLPLIEQLKEEGRLILPLGQGSVQMLTLVEKKENKIEYKEICSCVFVPLIGKYGVKSE